jgi:chromosome segregation ATPase
LASDRAAIESVQAEVERLEQHAGDMISAVNDYSALLSELSSKFRMVEAQQQAAGAYLKEQLEENTKAVEATLNEQVARRLQYLEDGYHGLLQLTLPPEVAERKWQGYRKAVGGSPERKMFIGLPSFYLHQTD